MIVPSIDLAEGKVVQLVGGEDKALERDDAEALARRFARYGEVNVIDLDAARGRGDNTAMLRSLLRLAPCNVGGGIRTPEQAAGWIKAGARRVILGSAAFGRDGVDLEFLESLRRTIEPARVVLAVDARSGKVTVSGWQEGTELGVLEAARAVAPYCGALLYTCVEREGRLGGGDLETARALREALPEHELYVAGGLAEVDEIRALVELRARPVLGMAIYTGKLQPEMLFADLIDFEKGGGLVPTVVTDEQGQVLSLVYSNRESLVQSLDTGRATYWSRSRQELWEKGLTSGNTQTLLDAAADCDRDALVFRVRARGPACHLGSYSCFGPRRERPLRDLWTMARQRLQTPADGLTDRLLADSALLAGKIREEADEVASADSRENLIWELADLAYFCVVRAAGEGIEPEEVLDELKGRMR